MINGKHRRRNPSFPEGSEIDIAHAEYSESTTHRDRARKSYDVANKAHTADFKRMSMEEKTYYNHSTDKLLPTQHADLSGRALDLGDAAYKYVAAGKKIRVVLITVQKCVPADRRGRQISLRPSQSPTSGETL